MRDRLIVALDTPSLAEARALAASLRPAVRWFKVGSELFTAAGPAAVQMVLDLGAQVFLDLKFHDIPHTVAGAVRAAVRQGVSMLNVHVAGGEAMMYAAAEAAAGTDALLIGVTVLTSQDETDEQVVAAALQAQRCGLRGVVASAREVAQIKAACGSSFVVVTPGIRAQIVTADDQRRIATPAEALRAGADYLVVGRPITAAPDPVRAVDTLLGEMAPFG